MNEKQPNKQPKFLMGKNLNRHSPKKRQMANEHEKMLNIRKL